MRSGADGDGDGAPHRLAAAIAGAAVGPGDGRSTDAAAAFRPDLPAARLAGAGRGGGSDARPVAEAEHDDPVLAASSWSLPGELGVYCAGHPQVYSIGLAMGDRHSQYDLWLNPLRDVESFRGRTFIVVGGLSEEAKQAFETVEEPKDVVYSEEGRPVATWTIWVCHKYRGFASVAKGGF